MKDSFITKFSLSSIKRYRITLLALASVLILGGFTYTSLLKRDGFPPIEIPLVVLQNNYFVNDKNKVNEEITSPQEQIISQIPEVSSITSNTADNFSVLQISFPEGFDTKEGESLVQNALKDGFVNPENSTTELIKINASSVDGINDLVFTLSSNTNPVLLQESAESIILDLESLPEVKSASVISLYSEQIDSLTGQAFTYQEQITKISIKENGSLEIKNGVGIGIVKSSEVDSIELSNAVKNKIDSIKSEKLENIEVIYNLDQADILTSQINSLGENALSGGIAVLIIVFLFINFRASLITALFIPTTLAATFIILYLIGYSINVLVLFGLILVLGLFVDDATVVVESIDYYKKQGYKGLQAVKLAINNVGAADLSGTLTTLLVFVPLATISGVLGEFIRIIPITVIVALSVSLIIALTVVSFFSMILIPNETKSKKKEGFFRKVMHIFFDGLTTPVNLLGQNLQKLVRWYLSKRYLTIFVVLPISLVLIMVGGSFASQLKFSIFPEPKDTHVIGINANFGTANDLTISEMVVNEVNATIQNDYAEYIEQVSVNANRQDATFTVNLTEIGTRDLKAPELIEKLNKDFEDIENAEVKANLQSVGPPTSEYQFAMQLYSEDSESLESASKVVANYISEQKIGDFSVEDVKVDLLNNIAKIDSERYVQISAKLSAGADTATVISLQDNIKAEFDTEKLEEIGLSEDALGFDLGQESDNLESFNSAIFALAVALIAMYLLLVVQYNSLSQPFLIFIAIPFTFVGLFPGLVLTNNPMSFFVVIGLTGLIGIVVNNSIMLVDFANTARAEGKSIKDSIAEAIGRRTRPILTTSLTSVVGLLPLALQDPFWESLAYTIIFGLVSSTIMVLVFFPAYYAVLEKVRMGTKRRIKNLLVTN